MEDWMAIKALEEYNTNKREICPTTRKAIERGIDALYFEMRARELFDAVLDLFEKQRDSDYTLNLLEETVDYDLAENDGLRLMEDIRHLLIDNS